MDNNEITFSKKKMKCFLAFLLFSSLFSLIGIFSEVDILLVMTTILFIFAVCMCFEDIYSNIFYFIFILSMYVFLVSGDVAEDIFHVYYYQRYSEEAVHHNYICLFISFLFLTLGYFFLKQKREASDSLPSRRFFNIKKASKIVFYCTYFIMLYTSLEALLYVMVNGYVSYYMSFSSILPSFIAEIGDFCPIALCGLFATLPKRKDVLFPVFLFVCNALVQFVMGQRGSIVYAGCFVFAYFLFRNKYYSSGKKWIPTWVIVCIIICIPFGIIVLELYGYIREGTSFSFSSLFDIIVEFFVNIGASSKVIKAGYDYRNEFTSFRGFSFGDTLNYFRYSSLFNWFTKIPAVGAHTEAYALEGHDYGSFISYLTMKENFLSGAGAGSSFVACLYADFGYIGVAIGSLAFAVFFRAVSNIKRGKWFITTIILYAFYNCIKSPRGSFDAPIACTVTNVSFWVAVLFIYALSCVLNSENNALLNGKK